MKIVYALPFEPVVLSRSILGLGLLSSASGNCEWPLPVYWNCLFVSNQGAFNVSRVSGRSALICCTFSLHYQQCKQCWQCNAWLVRWRTYCSCHSLCVCACMSVCLSVCLAQTWVAKVAEPFEMLFGMDPKRHVLDGLHMGDTWQIWLYDPCLMVLRAVSTVIVCLCCNLLLLREDAALTASAFHKNWFFALKSKGCHTPSNT